MANRPKAFLFGLVSLLVATNLALLVRVIRGRSASSESPKATGTPTFAKDVAPILFAHCAGCHRPGQSAPFSLLTYGEVKKRATQIAEITSQRVMPPWLPESSDFEFAGARRLTPHQIAVLQDWAQGGVPEGNPSDQPPPPQWTEGWELGRPDLILDMPQPYTLPAEGRDVYRFFVIPAALSDTRYVRAVELQPGNARIVHHATLQLDDTPSCRQLDAIDAEPGFSGFMVAGKAHLPDGFFIGWTPGKIPFNGHEGTAWQLRKGADLVLQLHLRPTGKPESVRARIGLYFAERPPARRPVSLVIRNKLIDLPAGRTNYVIEESYTLPVDVEVLSIAPHAHYLGREMEVTAEWPDRTGKNLIRIRDWNSDWQDEYRYARPVSLPAGTRVRMRYTYDNSEMNVRNPNHPPRRVTYGRSATDEMAELLLQVLPRTSADREMLRRDSMGRALEHEITRRQERLKIEPDNALEHTQVAALYQQLGKPDGAMAHLRRAVELQPASAHGHFLLGDALARLAKFPEALKELEEAVRLDAALPEALNSLARVLATIPHSSLRDPDRAVSLAARAAELTGNEDPGILETLLVAYAEAGQMIRAEEIAQTAIAIASRAGAEDFARAIQDRLEFYRQRSR